MCVSVCGRCCFRFIRHTGNGRSGALHCGIQYLLQLMVSECRNIICVENVCFSEHLNDDFVFPSCSVPVAAVINTSCAHVCSCLSFFISVCPSGRKESPLFSSWRGKERHPSHSTQPRLWRTGRALLSLCSAVFPLRKTGTWGLQGGEDRNPYPEGRERMFTCHYSFWQHQQQPFHKDGVSSFSTCRSGWTAAVIMCVRGSRG